MNVSRQNRKQRFLVRFSIGFMILFMFWVIYRPGDKETFENIYYLLMQFPPIFAAVGCFAYARRGKHAFPGHKRGWKMIGSSCLCYLFANGLWVVYSLKYHDKVPFPSYADVGWLAVFPFLIGGVSSLFARIPASTRVRLLLDSGIATSSLGALSWFFVVQRLWNRSGISIAAKLVSVAYPLLDIIAIFCALAMLNSLYADRKSHRSYLLLALGVIFWSFSDIVYSYARFQTGFQSGSWTDFGWPGGGLLIGFASRLRLWHSTETKQNAGDQELEQQYAATASSSRLLTPYLAVGMSLIVVIVADLRDDGHFGQGTFFLALGMMSLLLLRQVFTLWENRHLTQEVNHHLAKNNELNRRLVGMNEHLEGKVNARTRQLSSLLELTQAVNSTLSQTEVVALALAHTQQALEADAVSIHLLSRTNPSEARSSQFFQSGLEEASEAFATLAGQPFSAAVTEFECHDTAVDGDSLIGHCLSVPLLWQQQLMGNIAVVFWHRTIELPETDLLKNIGIEVGVALENSHRYQAAVEASDRDPVTGLYNHRAIHALLDKSLAHSDSQGTQLTVCMLDINNFKLFNDTYGHLVGDEVLQRVATALQTLCEDKYCAARYGGDEFLLVLPTLSPDEAAKFGATLQEAVSHYGFQRDGEERIIPISLSLGMATYPEDGTTRHSLLMLADTNMYQAKNSIDGIRGTSDVQRLTHELRADSTFSVLDGMVTAVNNKDSYTRKHSEDVTEYALWIAEEMQLSEETLNLIRVGGLLHDVGKIGVPSEILCKPGRLTEQEYEILKRHTHLGSLIVSSIPEMVSINDAVRSHHERWDGKGYPDATKGEDTPLLGRLIGVADAFSAMTTDRPYRRGTTWDKGLQEIVRHSGSQFDPIFADAFVRAVIRRFPALSTFNEIKEDAAISKAA